MRRDIYLSTWLQLLFQYLSNHSPFLAFPIYSLQHSFKLHFALLLLLSRLFHSLFHYNTAILICLFLFHCLVPLHLPSILKSTIHWLPFLAVAIWFILVHKTSGEVSNKIYLMFEVNHCVCVSVCVCVYVCPTQTNRSKKRTRAPKRPEKQGKHRKEHRICCIQIAFVYNMTFDCWIWKLDNVKRY